MDTITYKCTAISDTHGKHSYLNDDMGSGDFLFHCGDFMPSFFTNNKSSLYNFIEWFKSQNYKHKIFIGGNHDQIMTDIGALSVYKSMWQSHGVHYLCDELVELDGIKIYGSPWTPTFKDWFFMKNRGEEIAQVWAKIPSDIDVLITHGPPYGILDDGQGTLRHGCEELYKRVWEVRPKVHLFGHIHYAYGQRVIDDIEFINSSSLNDNYVYANKPVEFLLKKSRF